VDVIIPTNFVRVLFGPAIPTSSFNFFCHPHPFHNFQISVLVYLPLSHCLKEALAWVINVASALIRIVIMMNHPPSCPRLSDERGNKESYWSRLIGGEPHISSVAVCELYYVCIYVYINI
jgi:hypothetical protein